MTTQYQVVSWRDIPAQVKVKAGSRRKSRPLSERFIAAIDEAAMRAGKTGSDEYMAEWHSSDWQELEGDLEEIANTLVAELEAAYSNERLQKLVEGKGREKQEK
jgi:hypothetical protein